MNKKLLLHIGLHKTGSTFLQQLIFKKISKDYNLKSNLIDNSISNEILKKLSLFKSNINCLSSLEKIDLQNGIISDESLCAPRSNPAYYEPLCNFNYKMFGPKAHVLIVIRKPSEFLRSIYLQNIHKGKMISIDQFFLNKVDFDKKKNDKNIISNYGAWNLEIFNYQYLINLYKQKFEEVTVCKFEDVFKLNYLNKIFNLEENYISNLRQRNSHKKLNKAFSNSAVSLSFFLEKNLNKVGMSLSQKNIFSNIKLNNKFIKLLRHNLTYKKIVSNTLDQIIPYKKFKINFSNFEYFDLEKADKDYENIIT